MNSRMTMAVENALEKGDDDATMDMVKEAFRTLAFSFDELDFHDLKSPPGYECKYQVVPEESVALYMVKAAEAEASMESILDVLWSPGQSGSGCLRRFGY